MFCRGRENARGRLLDHVSRYDSLGLLDRTPPSLFSLLYIVNYMRWSCPCKPR